MILITYGTRPEYIKIKPLIDEMSKQGIPYKTLCSGQHRDILKHEADFNLTMADNPNGNRLDDIITNCMNLPSYIFEGIKYVLVQGDTTSVVGLSLSAMHRKIKVIHLEAGLRTYNKDNPFPEENNRMVVSTIADIHLCPTEDNKLNLLKEGVNAEKIYVVGNTVLDSLLDYKSKVVFNNKVLVTLHRRENHDIIPEWFEAVNQLVYQHPELEFILPIHPNPNVLKYKHLLKNVNIIEPMSHNDLINLLIEVKLVITDSGGIQEECSFFGKKCLVCRKVTERPESVGKTSIMIPEPSNLVDTFNKSLINYSEYEGYVSPYGQGDSAIRICELIKELK